MATKVSTKNLETVTDYEPGLRQWFGITDETTDTKMGTIIRVQVPPQVKSVFHCHKNADMFFLRDLRNRGMGNRRKKGENHSGSR